MKQEAKGDPLAGSTGCSDVSCTVGITYPEADRSFVLSSQSLLYVFVILTASALAE